MKLLELYGHLFEAEFPWHKFDDPDKNKKPMGNPNPWAKRSKPVPTTGQTRSKQLSKDAEEFLYSVCERYAELYHAGAGFPGIFNDLIDFIKNPEKFNKDEKRRMAKFLDDVLQDAYLDDDNDGRFEKEIRDAVGIDANGSFRQ